MIVYETFTYDLTSQGFKRNSRPLGPLWESFELAKSYVEYIYPGSDIQWNGDHAVITFHGQTQRLKIEERTLQGESFLRGFVVIP